MAALDLTKYGITGVTEILHNPSYEVLFDEENKPGLEGFDKGQLTELDAMNVMTRPYSCYQFGQNEQCSYHPFQGFFAQK